MIVPTNLVPVPSVAELSTCQNTLQGLASVDQRDRGCADAGDQRAAGLEDPDLVGVVLPVQRQVVGELPCRAALVDVALQGASRPARGSARIDTRGVCPCVVVGLVRSLLACSATGVARWTAPPIVISSLPGKALPGRHADAAVVVVRAGVRDRLAGQDGEGGDRRKRRHGRFSAWALAAIGPARKSAPRAAAEVNRAGPRTQGKGGIRSSRGILYVVDQGARTEVSSPEGGVGARSSATQPQFWYEKSVSAN